VIAGTITPFWGMGNPILRYSERRGYWIPLYSAMPMAVSHIGRKSHMKIGVSNPPQNGVRWIFCRYRRVKNSTRMLDAWDYGYDAWRFPARK